MVKQDLKQLEKGILIDETKINCKVKKISKNEIELVIHEGKNRVVRRLMEALGKKVFMLVRTKIGNLELRDLKSGEVRELTSAEIRDLAGKK